MCLYRGIGEGTCAVQSIYWTKRSFPAENKESAQNRTSYVLRRMFETGRLSSQEYDVLRDSELPFKRGEFRFKPSTTLDAVESRLARPPFPELFEHLGIEDPLNSGLQIITTLDADAQRWAQYGLRHHLSEVGSYLEKLSPKDLIEIGARPPVGVSSRDDSGRQPLPRQCGEGRGKGNHGWPMLI